MRLGSWQQRCFLALFIHISHYNPLPLSEVLLSTYFHLSVFVFDNALPRTVLRVCPYFILLISEHFFTP